MKFGLSIKVAALLSLLVLSGCSTQKHSTEQAHSTSSSVQKSSQRTKTPEKKKQVKSSSENGQIQHALQTCVNDASKKTSGYVKVIGDHQAIHINGSRRQRSASDIKIFVMVEAFRQIKAGTLHLNDMVSIPQDDKVGGTGQLANQDTNRLSCINLLNLMIKNSDNTATNVLIDKLGGLAPINKSIQELGCNNTRIQRKMLDYTALKAGRDNYTSADDVGKTLNAIYTGQLLGSNYDAQMLQLLKGNANQSKIPALIRGSATIYNKTGEFPDYGVQNDAAIIKHKNRAFIAVVLSDNGSQNSQIKAMNILGKQLFQTIFE